MSGQYSGEERRREVVVREETVLSKWLSPTAVTVLLGGIIWGVQLNFAVSDLTKEVAKANVAAEKTESRVDRLAQTLLRVTVILERVEKRMSKLEDER